MRDDVVNGTHWDFYAYDEVSGRLSAVQDVWTGEVNSFVWNPEGTLARWDASSVAYDRVFAYDEEGRLTKIERDYGNGSLQVAYVYGYNGDGIRVWRQDMLAQQEYRYVCRIGCGGVPMRVYSRAMGTTNWNTQDAYLDAPTVRWYGAGSESGQDYARWLLYDGHGNWVRTMASDYTLSGWQFRGVWGELQGVLGVGRGYCANLGHPEDETGLVSMRARYYEPATGRFLSEDPAWDGVNWYLYADGNPAIIVDPSGCLTLAEILIDIKNDVENQLRQVQMGEAVREAV